MNPVRYDFTKPGRISAEAQNRLLGWFRAAFAQANKTWTKQVPLALEATLGDLDVRYAREALPSLADGMLGYRVMVDGGRLPTFLIVPRIMVLRMVAAMLGDNDPEMKDRDLTVIEENLADYFLITFWLPFFRETWPKSKPVPWTLEQRDANPQASRLFGADEVLVSLNWQLRGSWGEANAVWFFQKKGLFEALGAADTFAPDPAPPDVVQKRRHDAVIRLPLLIEVVLGTADLKLSEVSHLQVGDVVMLDQSADEPIVARIGGRDLFRGKPGRTGSWKAFRIESHDKR